MRVRVGMLNNGCNPQVPANTRYYYTALHGGLTMDSKCQHIMCMLTVALEN